MRLMVDVPNEALEELRKTWNELFADILTDSPVYKSIHEKEFLDKVREAILELIWDW